MILHDMRAPLGVIMVHAESLASEGRGADADTKRRADAIGAQADRLNGFLNDMLMLAKLEAGKLLVNRVIVDPIDLVRSRAIEHGAVAESKGISLVADLPEKGKPVMLDPALVGRVLDNLLSNAVKYSSSGDDVRLVFRHLTDKGRLTAGVRIEVRDHGPGIPVEERARIFEKFEVIPTKRRGVAQVGLGLSFSKMAVEAMGGTISVEDNPPRGSTFVVEL